MSTVVGSDYVAPGDTASKPIDTGPPKSYRELVVRMADGEEVSDAEIKIILQGAGRRRFQLKIDTQSLADRRRMVADLKNQPGNERAFWNLVGSGSPKIRKEYIQLGLATGVLGRQLSDLEGQYVDLPQVIENAKQVAATWERRLENVLDGEPTLIGHAPWYRQSSNPLRRSDPQEPDGRSIKTIVAERRVVLEKSERRLGELTKVRDRISELKEQMADLRRQQQPILKRLQVAENMAFTD